MADATYIPSVTNAPSSLPPYSQWLGQLCFAVTGSGEKVEAAVERIAHNSIWSHNNYHNHTCLSILSSHIIMLTFILAW